MKSTTNVLYPKLVPRSVIQTSLAPSVLVNIPAMSHGARNCPFLILTILSVAQAALIKSVCLHKNAGICNTSTASPYAYIICSTCNSSCTSVNVCILYCFFNVRKSSSVGPKPIPRLPCSLLRLALS